MHLQAQAKSSKTSEEATEGCQWLVMHRGHPGQGHLVQSVHTNAAAHLPVGSFEAPGVAWAPPVSLSVCFIVFWECVGLLSGASVTGT